MGRGVVLEGLEVRWWLVSAILKVLMRHHKWYREDKRLFDVALGDHASIFAEPTDSQQEARVRQHRADVLSEGEAFSLAEAMPNVPRDEHGNLCDLRRADQFLKAGFEVRIMDEDPQPPGAQDGKDTKVFLVEPATCLLYTSPSPRDGLLSRMPSSA